MSPPPPRRAGIFLNSLTTFLVLTLQQVHLYGPFAEPFLCDPSFTPTDKAFHYHWGLFTRDGLFLPLCGPTPGRGGEGSGCSVPASYVSC